MTSSTIDTVETVSTVLAQLGRYQFFLLIGLVGTFTVVGINDLLPAFHTYTPSFYCADYNITDSCDFENEQCPSGFEFDDTDDRTVVTEWSLICSRRLLQPLLGTVYFCGAAVGAPLFGFVGDTWGRRIGILIAVHLQAILHISLYFANSFTAFIALRTLQGAIIQGVLVCVYITIQEYAPESYRNVFGPISDITWTLGTMILGITSYFVGNWRDLQLYLAIPTIIILSYIWFIPESLVWLSSNGKNDEAMKQCKKIAKLNGNTELQRKLHNIKVEQNKLSEENQKYEFQIIPLELFKIPCLRKNLFAIASVWFTVKLSYFGVVLYIPNLSGNRHKNFLIGASIELVSYFFVMGIFSKFGRRVPLSSLLISSGMMVGSLGLLHTYVNDDINWFISALALIAKGLITFCYSGMAFYTCELFPTTLRTDALGICSLISFISCLIAPFLMIVSEYTSPVVPLSVMGVLTILSGLAVLVLPETVNRPMPNTVDEARHRWEKRRSISDGVINMSYMY